MTTDAPHTGPTSLASFVLPPLPDPHSFATPDSQRMMMYAMLLTKGVLDAGGDFFARSKQSIMDPNRTWYERALSAYDSAQELLALRPVLDMWQYEEAVRQGSSSEKSFAFPAAKLGVTMHQGSVHVHPMHLFTGGTAVGSIFVSGAKSVLIEGSPAARASDVGIAMGCTSFAPVFQITEGSTGVYIGGKRAARSLDATMHCGFTVMSLVALSTICGSAGLSIVVSLTSAIAHSAGGIMEMSRKHDVTVQKLGRDKRWPSCGRTQRGSMRNSKRVWRLPRLQNSRTCSRSLNEPRQS